MVSTYSGKRKKTWQQKIIEVRKSYFRAIEKKAFAKSFYRHLFFLNPDIEKYFEGTDWEHQEKALLLGLEHLFNFFDDQDSYHKKQVSRIGISHSKKNMNIHPHHYYYWLDALVMTMEKCDPEWYDDLRFYIRESLFFPISFIISLYLK